MKEIPNDFIIRFEAGQEAKLVLVSETKGVYKFETSYTSINKNEGTRSKLIITVEHSFLSEGFMRFYRQK
jgi:hypothetical protein